MRQASYTVILRCKSKTEDEWHHYYCFCKAVSAYHAAWKAAKELVSIKDVDAETATYVAVIKKGVQEPILYDFQLKTYTAGSFLRRHEEKWRDR